MNKLSHIVLTAGVATLIAFPVFAKEDTAKHHAAAANTKMPEVSMVVLLQNLKNSGYVLVKEVELDGNTYKVVARNSAGDKVKFKVDAQTGTIPADVAAKPEKRLTMLEAVAKIKDSGYTYIQKVEFEDGKYNVKAFDKDGKKIEFHINPMNGNISHG